MKVLQRMYIHCIDNIKNSKPKTNALLIKQMEN